MTARKPFRYPKEAIPLGAALSRFHETGDVGELVNTITERDQRLEDFLRTVLPADSGVVTVTTDGAGRAVIIHRLTFTPRVVVAGSMGPDTGTVVASVIVTALTDTTFTVRLLDNTGAAIASTAGLTVGWIASL